MRPFFSVIMPVYNGEKYLRYALDSVVNQDFDDYEFLIVNDGSTDTTQEILDEYAGICPNIRLFRQENKGMYAAINVAMEQAAGEYTLFLGADDQYEPGSFQRLADYGREYNCDAVLFNLTQHEVGPDGKDVVTSQAGKATDSLFWLKTEDELRRRWLDMMVLGGLSNNTNMYRTAIIRNHPYETKYFGSDVLFNIALANDLESALYVPGKFYNFYIYTDENQEAGNVSIGKYYDYLHEMYNVTFERYYGLFLSWGTLTPDVYTGLAWVRCNEIEKELASLHCSTCPLSPKEKVEKLAGVFDETTLVALTATGQRKRYDEIVLVQIWHWYSQCEGTPELKGKYANRLIRILSLNSSASGLTKKDLQLVIKLLTLVITDPENKGQLGFTMMEQTAQRAPQQRQILEYYHTVDECRMLIHSLQLGKAAPLIAKLKSSKISNAEKYTLPACWYSYTGQVDEAVAWLEAGQKLYPGDKDIQENLSILTGG